MRCISKEILIDLLLLIEEKASLVISRNESILSVQDFLVSRETAKKIDEKTSSQLFSNYPQVYWRGVFGCRNIISHEYGNVDPEQIFGIIKKYLPELIACVRQIIDDVKQGNFDYLFT